ncbi:MAG: DegT/DnrJ/EryC1/StrS family aminotransferase, partial [Verrucomicrobia bacterium]
NPQIPLARPWFGREEAEAVAEVLDSGWVVQGAKVRAFEEQVAALHELPEGVAVSSATAGLHLTMLALGIGPGDVVLTPSFAWPAAAHVAARSGAGVWFTDVDPVTANLTPVHAEAAFQAALQATGRRPRALVIVHEFGLPAPAADLAAWAREREVTVIEDAACALGARHRGRPVGHFGVAAVFSFHPRKSITTGEGGVVVTADRALADRLRELRNHGQAADGRREFVVAGLNYRLTEIQAAIGLVQLRRFPEIQEIRRRLAETYRGALADLPEIQLPPGDPEHTWQTFMVVFRDARVRAAVEAACHAAGIGAGPAAVAAHRAPEWNGRFLSPADHCPTASRLADCGLALPLHPQLRAEELDRVVQRIRTALSRPSLP